MEPIGVYLHIPFCRRKCAYCDFFSGTGTDADLDAYQDALCAKIEELGVQVTEPVGSVYFGGGTPSVMGTQRLCALLQTVQKAFHILVSAEITLEVNPESGLQLNFAQLRQTGFNRVSVGLQSAIPQELAVLERIHTPEEAAQTVRMAQEAGFVNTSLDLMLGIPHQTKESLRQSIEFCASCGVKHISTYLLKIEKGTRFNSIKEQLSLPDEDEQAELYLFTVEALERLGYRQYEISNFAVPGFESRHNTLYWRCGEYIGVGPSAYSFYHGRRFHYERSMKRFCEGAVVSDGEGGGEEEFVMLALRLKEGLSYADYEKRFGKSFPVSSRQTIERFTRFGLMETDGQRACFTPKGFLVSNTILAELI